MGEHDFILGLIVGYGICFIIMMAVLIGTSDDEIKIYESTLLGKQFSKNGKVTLYFSDGNEPLRVYTAEKIASELEVGEVYKIEILGSALLGFEEVGE